MTSKIHIFKLGVYKHDGPYKVYIDVTNVAELRKTTVDPSGILLGASTTLTETIALLKKAVSSEGFEYADGMRKHIERIANVPVRSVSIFEL